MCLTHLVPYLPVLIPVPYFSSRSFFPCLVDVACGEGESVLSRGGQSPSSGPVVMWSFSLAYEGGGKGHSGYYREPF